MNPTPKTEPIPNPNQNNYDLYINFLGIFICIYALAKVTHIAEMYMAKRIRHKIYIPSLQEPDLQDNETLNYLQERQENLKWKLNNLEQQNQEIKSKLKNVLDNEATSARNLDEKVQNVVITNKHINVNRQIYINEGGVLNMTTAEKKQPKFSTIWDKYMDLKDSLDLKTTEQISTPLPVIMSSEELKKIKGEYFIKLNCVYRYL